MAELLSEEEIASRLERSEWRRDGDEILREWQLEDFAEAMSFVNIFIHGWNKVRLSLTNHAAGGPTDADFEMAGRIDSLG